MSNVKIPIDSKVLYSMYEYAHFAHKHYKSEIAGWAYYNRNKGIYKLAPLLKQEASGAEVLTFPSGNDISAHTAREYSEMIVQWHSHVYFECNPSQPDKDLIVEALGLYPMIISVIVNCKNEYSATIAIKQAGAFEFDEMIKLDVELVPYYNNPEVSKNVKKKLYLPKPPAPPPIMGYHKSYFSDKYISPPLRGLPSPKSEPYLSEEWGAYGFRDEIEEVVPDIEDGNYAKILSVIQKLAVDEPTLELSMYQDYTFLIQDDKQKLNSVSLDRKNGLLCNNQPYSWSEVLRILGFDEKKYALT